MLGMMIFVELAVLAVVVFGFYRLRQWLGLFREENSRVAVQHSDELKEVQARVKDLQWQVNLWEQRMARWDDPRRLIWPEPVHLDRRLEALAEVAARPMAAVTDELRAFLHAVQPPDAASGAYLAEHRERLAFTLAQVPAGGERALELGTYGAMAAAVQRVFGYRAVEGGDQTGSGEMRVEIAGQAPFVLPMRAFDAERDRYPYADDSFDLVLACEIIEHFVTDPMHCLLECRRVLRDGGTLLLSTPNIASHTAIGRVLQGCEHPNLFPQYSRESTHRPHVHEYAPYELATVLRDAGFEVVRIATRRAANFDSVEWVTPLLEKFRFPTLLRGEQLFVVAEKRAANATVRYPAYLYEAADPRSE